MKILVQFKTLVNVVWGTPVDGREAFAFMRGFPATFLLTQRRAIVVAEFMEKQGWLKKKRLHALCFEAALQHVKEFTFHVVPARKVATAFISFHPHGQLGEGTVIQFLKMNPQVWSAIDEHLRGLDVKSPLTDSGIVHVDSLLPRGWLKARHGLETK